MKAALFEKIDEYLHGKLPPAEQRAFESELAADQTLSAEVELYKLIEAEMHDHDLHSTNEELLKSSLQKLNRSYFTLQPAQSAKVVPLRRKSFFTIAASLTASLIIAVIIYFAFVQQSGTQQLAGNYIDTNLIVLGQTMDGSKDSLQQGIAAYNNKDYGMALKLFRGVSENHPDNSYAKRDVGLVYLVTKDYDRALQEFSALAEMKLFSNSGMFLKAVTLLQRNKEGDKEQAKKILQEVVKEKAEGSKDAEEWLNHW